MEIFKNDFDKLYEEVDVINSIFLLEDILEESRKSKILTVCSSIQDQSLKALFETTPNGLGIRFTDIVKVSNISVTDQNKTDLIAFWTTIKYLIESKPDQDNKQSTIHWFDRLNNKFFKPYLSEDGILQSVNSGEYPALAKLGLQYHSDQLFKDEHHYIFEGRGANLPDFSSSIGYSFDCKGGNSSAHGSDFIIYYNAKYSKNEGSFYIKTTQASLDGLLLNKTINLTDDEKNFLISICSCNGKVPYQTATYKLSGLEINHNNHVDIFNIIDQSSGNDKNKNKFDTTSISDPELKSLVDQYIEVYNNLCDNYAKFTFGSIRKYYIYSDNSLEIMTDNIDHYGVKTFIDQVNKKAQLASQLKDRGIDISTLKELN